METKPIGICVDAKETSEQQNLKLAALLRLKLSNSSPCQRPLIEVMNDISRNAQARGLTPEILNSILNEE